MRITNARGVTRDAGPARAAAANALVERLVHRTTRIEGQRVTSGFPHVTRLDLVAGTTDDLALRPVTP